MGRVIHTGQALVDVVLRVDDLPRRGHNSMASSVEEYAGGSVNILVAAARSGATAVMAGAHGTGPHGDLIRAALHEEGIALHSAPVPDTDTGICVVLVESSAERTFITTQGAERQLSAAFLDSARPQPGDVVCVTGYSLLLPATRDPLLDWLPSIPGGCVIVTDPGAAFVDLEPAHRQAMLDLTDVWTSNLEEAQQLVGQSLPMPEAADAVAMMLTQHHAVVVVRDGDQGCAVWENGVTTVVPGFPQQPVDTNGAGDAHCGAMIAAFEAGMTWTDAARYANAAAAIKVTRLGPATAPTRTEVEAFLAAQPL